MEEANGSSQGQEMVSSQPAQVQTEAPKSDERVFRQSEVSDLVRRAKQDAVESYRRKAAEQPNYVEQRYDDNRLPSQSNQSPQFSEDKIRKLAAEEAQRHIEGVRQEAYDKSQSEMAQRTVQNFVNKIQAGKEKYQDFDSVALGIDFQRFPNVVRLLGDYIDNSADVLYALGQDKSKLIDLELKAERFPNEIVEIAQRLSKSIKDNEAASKTQLPNEPLSKLRPSNTGTDSGVMSVSDYRKKYRA